MDQRYDAMFLGACHPRNGSMRGENSTSCAAIAGTGKAGFSSAPQEQPSPISPHVLTILSASRLETRVHHNSRCLHMVSHVLICGQSASAVTNSMSSTVVCTGMTKLAGNRDLHCLDLFGASGKFASLGWCFVVSSNSCLPLHVLSICATQNRYGTHQTSDDLHIAVCISKSSYSIGCYHRFERGSTSYCYYLEIRDGLIVICKEGYGEAWLRLHRMGHRDQPEHGHHKP